jgi:transcriptional regulator with XRE-family HTH domain
MMNRLGERIKNRRIQLGLHLNELAEKVGISPSALSQIEKSKTYPSILTLKSIAENLCSSIGDLVGENESLVDNPLIRSNEIKYLKKNGSGAHLYLLSNHDINKQMDTYLIRLHNNSKADNLLKINHGQVFCYLISGEVKFILEEEEYILKNGDNIYFNGRRTFEITNNQQSLSELLLVQSPSSFTMKT